MIAALGLGAVLLWTVVAEARPAVGPAASQPAASQPATSQPAASQPATSQPATSQPATGQPATGQPAGAQPAGPRLDPYDPRLDQRGTPAPPPMENRLPPPSAKPGVKRPVPDYDARAAQRATAGDVLVWIPRGLLLPVHLTLEYLVRRPVVGGMTWMEEHYVFDRVKRFFGFRGGKSYLFPTAFVDFGLNPTVGFININDDLFVDGHNLTLQGGFWAGWVNLLGTSTFPVFVNDTGMVTLQAQYFTRPDRVFHGVGPDSLDENESFFRLRMFESLVELRGVLKDLNRITFGVHCRDGRISDAGDDYEQPPIAAIFDVGDPSVVPGFGRYRLIESEVKLELDSRAPERVFTPGSGLRLELFGAFAVDPGDRDLNFFRWGGEAAGFVDLSGVNHVLALAVYSEFIEQTGDQPVPISELILLGGPEQLRGFLEGRMRGQSAFVTTINYRYPVWSFLDADVHASIGNVFDGRLDHFHVKRMRFSWGLGLRSNTSRIASFDILLAFGTTRFDADDFEVEHVRFVFGVNQGF